MNFIYEKMLIVEFFCSFSRYEIVQNWMMDIFPDMNSLCQLFLVNLFNNVLIAANISLKFDAKQFRSGLSRLLRINSTKWAIFEAQ